MTPAQFVTAYAIKTRALAGLCDGVTIYTLRVPNPTGVRWFGVVVDAGVHEFVPLSGEEQAQHFEARAAHACHDAAAEALQVSA